MVGGDKAAFDIALPVFQAFGKNNPAVRWRRRRPAIKLVNQLLVGVHTAPSAERPCWGRTLGADRGPPRSDRHLVRRIDDR